MCSSVIALKNESKRRLDKLHAKCIEKAKSKKSFDRSFVIESDHIIKRGTDQNSSLRSAIQNEHKASLIIHGRINYPTSNDTHPNQGVIDKTIPEVPNEVW